MTLHLVKNTDILSEVSHRDNRPFTVGFAAESEKIIEHAQSKLERKKLDLIIANDISRSDIGFNQDDNELILLSSSGQETLPKDTKRILAKTIVARIAKLSAESLAEISTPS